MALQDRSIAELETMLNRDHASMVEATNQNRVHAARIFQRRVANKNKVLAKKYRQLHAAD